MLIIDKDLSLLYNPIQFRGLRKSKSAPEMGVPVLEKVQNFDFKEAFFCRGLQTHPGKGTRVLFFEAGKPILGGHCRSEATASRRLLPIEAAVIFLVGFLVRLEVRIPFLKG